MDRTNHIKNRITELQEQLKIMEQEELSDALHGRKGVDKLVDPADKEHLKHRLEDLHKQLESPILDEMRLQKTFFDEGRRWANLYTGESLTKLLNDHVERIEPPANVLKIIEYLHGHVKDRFHEDANKKICWLSSGLLPHGLPLILETIKRLQEKEKELCAVIDIDPVKLWKLAKGGGFAKIHDEATESVSEALYILQCYGFKYIFIHNFATISWTFTDRMQWLIQLNYTRPGTKIIGSGILSDSIALVLNKIDGISEEPAYGYIPELRPPFIAAKDAAGWINPIGGYGYPQPSEAQERLWLYSRALFYADRFPAYSMRESLSFIDVKEFVPAIDVRDKDGELVSTLPTYIDKLAEFVVYAACKSIFQEIGCFEKYEAEIKRLAAEFPEFLQEKLYPLEAPPDGEILDRAVKSGLAETGWNLNDDRTPFFFINDSRVFLYYARTLLEKLVSDPAMFSRGLRAIEKEVCRIGLYKLLVSICPKYDMLRFIDSDAAACIAVITKANRELFVVLQEDSEDYDEALEKLKSETGAFTVHVYHAADLRNVESVKRFL